MEMDFMKSENQNVFQADTVSDYDLDNGGLHSVFFASGNGKYFALARDFDEDDETIYFERDDQGNCKYVYPSNVQYLVQNGTVEFLFDDAVAQDDIFGKKFTISFVPLPNEDYEKMKRKLALIWGKSEPGSS